ncbi:glycosyltransferase [bacterium]|nr:glycosyltransferase [bacterium]
MRYQECSRVTAAESGSVAVPTHRHGPVVSVVVAAYNAAATLAETLDSVLAQTVADWELVVVDDGSTDDTLALARTYSERDPRFVTVSQPNAGTALARNHGFSHTSGAWVCFLDADDLLLPPFMERLLAAADQEPDADILSCNALYLLRDGGTRPVWRGARAERSYSLQVEDQLRESSILLMSLVRREVVDRVEGFRPLHSEDYDFWLRALISGARHRYVPEVLALYRRHEGSKTTSLVEEAESFLHILEQAREMPELTGDQRRACEEAIAFARLRLGRRRLEQSLLDGEYAGARSAYWRFRGAFPDRPKYLLGLALMLLSPRLYARIKSGRMI